MALKLPYPLDIYKRYSTWKVEAGNLSIGGDDPVRVQSMCNTKTSDIEASVAQAKVLFDAGAELVRYTVRHRKDVEALQEVKKRLQSAGYNSPIVADVHFNASLADKAAKLIEKVRINPGNFAIKRANFENLDFTNEEWEKDVCELQKNLKSLINICKQHNTALRIGTNHGSLSDRIMSRYGNTVEGMVESTMEMLRVCKAEDFTKVVVSLKSSNVRIMVQAYRNLVCHMLKEEMQFPLHLGVTEAGDGLTGRIKSAAGIGTLMADGLGDTIRVSLTENPVKEISVATSLVKYFAHRADKTVNLPANFSYNPFTYKKRQVHTKTNIATDQPVVVIDLRHLSEIDEKAIEAIGYKKQAVDWETTRRAAEYALVSTTCVNTLVPENLTLLYESHIDKKPHPEAVPVFTRAEYMQLHKIIRRKDKWLYLRNEELTEDMAAILRNDENVVIVLETTHPNGIADQRAFFLNMQNYGLYHPVIVKRNYVEEESAEMAIKASADASPLFVDGFGDGIWLTNPFLSDVALMHQFSFEILQAARARSTVTDYIACPSCGRTQFDIETVLQEVKARTNHLYHLKIAVMGCIVNGPGEMADADYGYVGAAPGKVTLYKGKTPVRKNISSSNAVDELIDLIKEHGDWISPEY